VQDNLEVVKIDDAEVSWNSGSSAWESGMLYVNVPAGEHTLTFNYREVSEYTSGNRIYTTTTSASGLTTKATLTAGHTYKTVIHHYEGNKIGAEIVEVKADDPKDTFSAPETKRVVGIGMDIVSHIGVSTGLQLGQVFDGITRMGWHIDLGAYVGYRFGNDESSSSLSSVGAGLYGGGTYECYFPKTDMGLSLGTGVTFPWTAALESGESTLYPYARLGFIPSGGKFKFSIFADYYFTSMPIKLNESELYSTNRDISLNTFGVGASLSF
jgi:hypothetical protein